MHHGKKFFELHAPHFFDRNIEIALNGYKNINPADTKILKSINKGERLGRLILCPCVIQQYLTERLLIDYKSKIIMLYCAAIGSTSFCITKL